MKHIIGAVSLPIMCIACPAGLPNGTNAHAIWSITIAMTAMSFKRSEVIPCLRLPEIITFLTGLSGLFDMSIAIVLIQCKNQNKSNYYGRYQGNDIDFFLFGVRADFL